MKRLAAIAFALLSGCVQSVRPVAVPDCPSCNGTLQCFRDGCVGPRLSWWQRVLYTFEADMEAEIAMEQSTHDAAHSEELQRPLNLDDVVQSDIQSLLLMADDFNRKGMHEEARKKREAAERLRKGERP